MPGRRRLKQRTRLQPGAAGWRSLAALHAAVILFGLSGLFAKWVIAPATTIVFVRSAIAALVLYAVMRARGRAAPRFGAAMTVGGVVLAAHWVSFFAAIQASDVATGLLGFASFPLFVLPLEAMFAGRRWRAGDAWVALLVGSGLALVALGAGASGQRLPGLALGVLSGCAFAVLTVANRRAMMQAEAQPRRQREAAAPERAGLQSGRPTGVRPDAMSIAFAQNAVAALVLTPFAWGGPLPSPPEWLLLAVLGIACTALAHTLYVASMRERSAHTASVAASLEPVYGIAFALLLIGERPSALTLGGGALIVAASLAAARRDRQ